jgi:hypothetical protein
VVRGEPWLTVLVPLCWLPPSAGGLGQVAGGKGRSRSVGGDILTLGRLSVYWRVGSVLASWQGTGALAAYWRLEKYIPALNVKGSWLSIILI